MRKLSGNRMLAILLTGLAILTAWPTRAGGPQFVSPRIATASDIPYPVNTATPGIVTLLLNLDVTGKVVKVQPQRCLLLAHRYVQNSRFDAMYARFLIVMFLR